MADEQAQAESTALNNIEQSPVSVSEDDQTQPGVARKEPDFQVAMHEERRKRQELESRLSDPNFIYERARSLGLAEDETDAVPAVPAAPSRVAVPESNVSYLVKQQLEIEKAKERYPDLSTDDNLGRMVSALIEKGMGPLAAADEVYSYFNKAKASAQAEGAKEKEQQIAAKEQAQTISGGHQVTDELDELSKLRQQARSADKRTANTAMLEIIKRRNKTTGVFQ